MSALPNEAARVGLVTCFAEALERSLSGGQREEWRCVPVTSEPVSRAVAQGGDGSQMGIRLRGTLHGCVLLVLDVQKDSGTLEDGDVSSTVALNGTWQQITEELVQYLPKRAADSGRYAFSVESHGAQQSSAEGVRIGRIELRSAGGARLAVQVIGDQELAGSLYVADWSSPNSQVRAQREPSSEAQIGRVIDVPLSVTLRFGERKMRLREVLELNTGSLVELDRQVEEPVDLLLGERVIARGEVVIVDGNYGLRITEIVESAPMRLLQPTA